MSKVRGARRTNVLLLGGVQFVLLVAALAAAPQMGRRTIYVTALDRNGRPVPGLTADDFRVREDGRVRGIAQAEVATQPMQIALLLDDGGPSLAAIRQATGQFVERLQRRAWFSLTTTGGQLQTRVSSTDDPRQIYDALQNTFANVAPTTHFLDAVLETARGFVRRRVVRPVIVAIVTEGEELSTSRANVVLEAIQQSGAVFYYIGLGTPVTSGTRSALDANRAASSTEYESVQRNTVIGSAPRNSGGRSEQVLLPAGIEPLMLEFAAELTGQYAVTYESDARQARLEVTTLRPGVKLRAPARVGEK
jgi:VWFA-related protein